ncbi:MULTISPECIES: 2Fe-2S iron-sulfur cluster-binding protein [Methylococcus]|nr:2Fe-2S iron-sulfur cluster-binding protein [Methylococcus capsulatus]UQN11233.1 2Fe-2S iron-sulfur cluster-binding protein [Methylococcus capsulatus]
MSEETMSGYLRTGIRRNAKVCVTVLPSGKTVEISSGSRLLDAVLLTGDAIVPRCGGHARCGECHVLVRYGGRGLSKIRPDEREKLENMRGTETLSRLSCQAVLGSREITIELMFQKRG